MKKTSIFRAAAALIAVIFTLSLVSLAPVSAASVTFFAVDESLLDLGYGATYYGGELYVSPGVFSNVSGIYTSYSSSQKLITMYDSTSTLVFDLNGGTCYTVGGSDHEASGILSGGSPYVPLNFVCSYFGLSYSYLTTDIAPMIRLKTGSEILKDSTFVSAVSSTMSARYSAFVSAHPEMFSSPVTMCLLLAGPLDENTDALLDYFAVTGIRAAFFTDAASIEAHPDIVRRIYCQGHSLGVMCDGIDSAEIFNEKLFDLLSMKSRLAVGPETLSGEGYAVIEANVDARGIGTSTTVSRVVNNISKFSGGTAVIRMDVDENTVGHISQITRAMSRYYSWVQADETFAV